MSSLDLYANVSPGIDIPHVVNTIIEIHKGRRSKLSDSRLQAWRPATK